MALLNRFRGDENGQDLFEYTLLMALVALASAAVLIGIGRSVQGVWIATDSQLSAAVVSLPLPSLIPSVSRPEVAVRPRVGTRNPASSPTAAPTAPPHFAGRAIRAVSQLAANQFDMVSSWRLSFSREGRFAVSLSRP